MGPGMAKLYGLSQTGSGLTEQDLGPERVGFFSQLPFLTLQRVERRPRPDSSRSQHQLRCPVRAARPAVGDASAHSAARGEPDQSRAHQTLTTGCGGACHNEMINPVGFAFEHFDGMGQYRDTENDGLTIDSSGSYAFSDGTQDLRRRGEPDASHGRKRAGAPLLRQEARQLRPAARHRRAVTCRWSARWPASAAAQMARSNKC